MLSLLFAALFFVGGGAMMVFNRSFATTVIRQQNKFWGFHFGDRDIKIARVFAIVGGTVFFVIGFLSLLVQLSELNPN